MDKSTNKPYQVVDLEAVSDTETPSAPPSKRKKTPGLERKINVANKIKILHKKLSPDLAVKQVPQPLAILPSSSSSASAVNAREESGETIDALVERDNFDEFMISEVKKITINGVEYPHPKQTFLEFPLQNWGFVNEVDSTGKFTLNINAAQQFISKFAGGGNDLDGKCSLFSPDLQNSNTGVGLLDDFKNGSSVLNFSSDERETTVIALLDGAGPGVGGIIFLEFLNCKLF